MKKAIMPVIMVFILLTVFLFCGAAAPKFRSGGFHSSHSFKSSSSKSKSGLFHSSKSYKSSTNKSSKSKSTTGTKKSLLNGNSNSSVTKQTKANFHLFPVGLNLHFMTFIPFRIIILILIIFLIYLIFNKNKK